MVEMLRRKILKDTMLLNGSGLITQGIGMLRSFMIMRFLEPEALGIWLGLVVILGYTVYLNLGMDYGLALRIPYYRGGGQIERAEHLEHSVYLGWTIVGLLGAGGVVLYGLTWPGLSHLTRTGLAIIAVMTVLEQQSAFLGRWATSADINFGTPSLIAVIQSVMSFVVFVPLASVFGVSGIMWGSLVVDVIILALWFRWVPYRFRWRVSGAALWEAVRIGMPILIVTLAGAMIKTVDRVLILSLLGAGALGYYGVTNLGGSFLYGILAQAGNAISPHVVRAMGEDQDSAMGLERFLIRPTLAFAYLGAMVILLLTIVIPPFVELLLPKYQPGLPAFYLFVPGFFFLGIELAASTILNLVLIAKKRQRFVIYVQAIAIAAEIGFGWMLVRRGLGIAGVAIASTAAYAIYGTSILVLASEHVVLDPKRRREFLARVMVPFLYAVLVGVGLYYFRQHVLVNRPLIRFGVEVALSLTAIVPMLVRMNSEIAFRAEVLPILTGNGGLLMGFWTTASGVARRLRPWGSRT